MFPGFTHWCPRNVRGGLLTAFELHPDGVRCRRWCYGHERRREEVENNVKIQPNLCLLVSKWLCILLVTKSCAVYTFSIYSLLPPIPLQNSIIYLSLCPPLPHPPPLLLNELDPPSQPLPVHVALLVVAAKQEPYLQR